MGGGGRPLDLHTDLDEGGDDAGVLADGTMALGAHAGVDEDLRDGVLGGVRLLVLIRAGEVGDVIDRVIEADVLQRVGYGADYVVLADDGHRGLRIILWRFHGRCIAVPKGKYRDSGFARMTACGWLRENDYTRD